MGNSLYKEIWIQASIEEVFACFTQTEAMLAWHGKEVELDPVPGGIYKVVFEDGTVILGKYIEVIPNQRVVYTAQYGNVGSIITVDFITEKGGTTIKLHQQFEVGQDTSSFDNGWDYFLDLLKEKLVSQAMN